MVWRTAGQEGAFCFLSLSPPPPQTWGACLLFGLLQKYFHSAEFLLFLSPLPHPPFPLAQTHRCTFFFCFFLNVFFWWTFLTVWMCFSLFEMGCFVSVSIWDLPFILWHSWYFWSHHVFFFFFFLKVLYATFHRLQFWLQGSFILELYARLTLRFVNTNVNIQL